MNGQESAVGPNSIKYAIVVSGESARLTTTQQLLAAYGIAGSNVYDRVTSFTTLLFRLNAAKDPMEVEVKSGDKADDTVTATIRLVEDRIELSEVENDAAALGNAAQDAKSLVLRRLSREEAAERVFDGLTVPDFLANRRTQLLQFVQQFPGTPAAETAQRELDQLPTKEEIREIDATRRLAAIKLQLPKNPTAAKQLIQELVQRYPGTEAAREAADSLLPAVSREEQANRALRLAEMLMDANPAAAKRRFQEVIEKYPETVAAGETRRKLERFR